MLIFPIKAKIGLPHFSLNRPRYTISRRPKLLCWLYKHAALSCTHQPMRIKKNNDLVQSKSRSTQTPQMPLNFTDSIFPGSHIFKETLTFCLLPRTNYTYIHALFTLFWDQNSSSIPTILDVSHCIWDAT